MQIQINKDYTNHFVGNLDFDKYASIKTHVNSSSLKHILKSPASFKASFESEKETTAAMEFGSLLHTCILEHDRFKSEYAVKPDFGDMRKKENKAIAEEWMNAHSDKKFIAISDYERLTGIAESIASHTDAMSLLKNGQREMSAFYADPETGILCKSRFDFLSNDCSILVDLKTTQDCRLNEFSKTIWNYRYDFQFAMYSESIRVINGRSPDYHVFIACEKEAPFEVAVYISDNSVIEKGLSDYKKALQLLSVALEQNKFNKYQTQMETINLPAWAY